MKKILFLILWIFYVCMSTQATFALPTECRSWEFCVIANWTRPEIDQYVSNNTTVLNNLKRLVRANGDTWPVLPWESRIRRNLTGSFAKAVNPETYDSLFDFYVTSAMEASTPKEIYRDYQKLTQAWDEIRRLWNYIWDTYEKEIMLSVENICEWVVGSCSDELWNWYDTVDAWIAIWKIFENNSIIKSIYRRSAMWEEYKIDEFDVFLIDVSPESFRSIIGRYYGANASEECLSCSGFNRSISEGIKSISNTLWKQNTSYKAWVDARYTLIGHDSVDIAAKERILLDRELSNQWLSTTSAEAIAQNLERYNANNGWPSQWNNFISNTFRSIKNWVGEVLNPFTTGLDTAFEEKILEDPDEENPSISQEDLYAVSEKITSSSEIAREVSELYQTQLIFAAWDDRDVDLLNKEIINTLNNFADATDILNATIPISEEVCNSQWSNIDVPCSYWNHK